MTSVAFNFGLDDGLFTGIVRKANLQAGIVNRRRFPDGESYVRIVTECQGASGVLCADLSVPDAKLPSLLFASRILRDNGVSNVGLVAPYLPYMRQDKAFKQGEGISARYFAELLSNYFDWIVTVDPHLHRIASLDEVFDIPAKVVHASTPIADWISRNVAEPLLLVGPDVESKQWVGDVAARVGAPFIVLEKSRRGDRDVQISVPDDDLDENAVPVLIDDIVSSGTTMVAAAKRFAERGMPSATCVAVHALFGDECVSRLRAASVNRIVTCNSVTHPTNAIDLADVLAPAIANQIG